MIPIDSASPKCRECGCMCGGIGKNLLTVEDLAPVPAKCFVEEVDLDEGDKILIANIKRDGALVALIDSLAYSEQKELQSSVGCINMPHYLYNETTWVATAKYFFGKENGREPTADELFELNVKNDPKYRAEYMLLFPHMIRVHERITPEKITKLEKFLAKAEEVVTENIRKHGFNGACGYFTVQMAEALKANRLENYKPSYMQVILGKGNPNS